MDLWTFGWNQILTVVGFLITSAIAIGGFRTFSRWKREKIEERRIEAALETLAISYESKYVFDGIRSPMSFEHEWKDMPREPGEADQQWSQRGPYYAVRQRVVLNKDFFERVFALQPKFMALFGETAENTFMLLHRARREIEVASETLAWQIHNAIGPEPNRDQAFWEQRRRDIWDHGDIEPDKDRVGMKLRQFRSEIESLCNPIVDRGFSKKQRKNN